MKTREDIQADIACSAGDPVPVQSTEDTTLHVYPPSVGLLMALRAMGNSLAISLEDPAAIPQVTQQDTLVFYWAVTRPPAEARAVLTRARATGSLQELLDSAEAFAWLLTPPVVSALNAAIARTREQVQAVSVALIPDKNAEASKN